MNTDNHYDAIILGAGPAGLTAGIYLSRAADGTVAAMAASVYLNELKVKQKQAITI
jgi:thioredoxin reductase (NADPH)